VGPSLANPNDNDNNDDSDDSDDDNYDNDNDDNNGDSYDDNVYLSLHVGDRYETSSMASATIECNNALLFSASFPPLRTSPLPDRTARAAICDDDVYSKRLQRGSHKI
jgi:hypothetical protein